MRSVFRDKKIWRWLTDFWTISFIAFIAFNFFTKSQYGFLLAPFSGVYMGVLGIYVGTKEFDRWYEQHDGTHPGEFFVLAWTTLLILLFSISITLNGNYAVSGEVIAVYILVLTVFAISQKSKRMHRKKYGGNYKDYDEVGSEDDENDDGGDNESGPPLRHRRLTPTPEGYGQDPADEVGGIRARIE